MGNHPEGQELPGQQGLKRGVPKYFGMFGVAFWDQTADDSIAAPGSATKTEIFEYFSARTYVKL